MKSYRDVTVRRVWEDMEISEMAQLREGNEKQQCQVESPEKAVGGMEKAGEK